MATTTGTIHNGERLKTRAEPPSPDDRLRAALADYDEAATPEARQRLDDTALLHGLIHSERLDTAALWLVERAAALSSEAVREMASVMDKELRRRERR
jgi:hypothetical protein